MNVYIKTKEFFFVRNGGIFGLSVYETLTIYFSFYFLFVWFIEGNKGRDNEKKRSCINWQV